METKKDPASVTERVKGLVEDDPFGFFTFQLSERSRQDIATLVADVEKARADMTALNESELQVLDPFFQRLLGILTKLGDQLVLAKGYFEVVPTGANKG